MHDKDLDDLLALAAANRPAPDEALLDRVLADALAVQPRQVAPVRFRPVPLACWSGCRWPLAAVRFWLA